MGEFFFGVTITTMIFMIGFALDKTKTDRDEYKIAQCVELKKSLEERLADNSEKEDLQRKLEQLKNWESEK